MAKETAKDDLLSRYLLDELSEEERTHFEERYFGSEELFEDLVATDLELIDAYAQGDMPAKAREKFEAALRSSPRRLGRVEFAKDLARLSSSRPDELLPRASASSRFFAKFLFKPRAVLRWAAVVLLAGALSWLIAESLRLRTEQALLHATRTQLHRKVQELERQATLQRERLDRLIGEVGRQGPSPAGETRRQQGARTDSFLLTAGLLRDFSEGNRLHISSQAPWVILRLALETQGFEAYRVVIQRVGGKKIWEEHGLKPQIGKKERVISVRLPRRLLMPGDYVGKLSARATGARFESVAEYSFQVVRGKTSM